MPPTWLGECAPCEVLVHAAREGAPCPVCARPLRRGLVEVGFADARRVFGEPGAPYVPPADERGATRFPCADGHQARSREERVVDDWLSAHGIPHEHDPKLKGMRPDWRVGAVYIEYWGLAGQQGYEARRAQKLALYRARRLRLVELHPEDLADLEAKLGFLRDPAVWREGTLDGFG